MWFQQMAQNVTASANANPGFSMNAGDANFAQFADVPGGPPAPGTAATINTDYAVETMLGMVRLAYRGLRAARRYDKHCLRDRRGRRLELRPRRQPHDINRDGPGQGCRWCGNRWREPGASGVRAMAERFYAVQVRIWPRLVWGITALVLAHYEFKPPGPDWIGGIILTLIALWCFVTAARLIWHIGRISLWP